MSVLSVWYANALVNPGSDSYLPKQVENSTWSRDPKSNLGKVVLGGPRGFDVGFGAMGVAVSRTEHVFVLLLSLFLFFCFFRSCISIIPFSQKFALFYTHVSYSVQP